MPKNSNSKVILNMKMPEHCGACKFGMKTCEGKDFCFITRKSVNVDTKSKDCPLSEYTTPKKKSKPKKVPCKQCGSTRSTECVLAGDKFVKFFKCCKCGADSLSNPGTTWNEAILNWNAMNS